MTWVYRGEIKAEIKIDVGSVPNEAETHLFILCFFTIHSLLVFCGHCVAPLSTYRGEVPDSAKGFHCPECVQKDGSALVFFFFFFRLHPEACGIIIRQSGIEPVPPCIGSMES